MVLAGGRVDELSVLTAQRPKSAVPIWGMYRIIDFALSNMMHARIDVVGVLSQYRPYSLVTHLASGEPWDYVGRSRELRILTPFKGMADSDWYKGTADALYQNLGFIERFAPELVLVVSGDHVYSMDYRRIIERHLATGAELTIALKSVPRAEAHLYGTAALDGEGRVVTYEEKAANPRSTLASLTVYVFTTACLVERIRQNAAEGTAFQVYSEIIPRLVGEGARVFGYVFNGYWRYARTLDSYYATNMELLGDRAPDLAAWQVQTNRTPPRMGDRVPAQFLPTASVTSSLVCGDAVLGGRVERSILSPGVVVEPGATVRDSILFHGCTVAAGAVVDRAILDKAVRIGADAQVGAGADAPNVRHPKALASGVTVIGKACQVPAKIRIGRGCILAPGLAEASLTSGEIPAGTTVEP